MEIFIKDFSKIINLMVMENIFGKIKAILKGISLMVFGQVMECGRKVLGTRINTRVNTKMTKSGDTEFLHGQTVIYSRAVMKRI